MTQDEIIRMAREAGLIQYVQVEKTCVSNALERFAALVAAHEREKLAEQEPFDMDDHPPHRLCECRKCMEYFTPLPDCDAFAASGKPIAEQTNTQFMEGYRIGLAEMREKCATVSEQGTGEAVQKTALELLLNERKRIAASIRAIKFKGDTGFRPVSEMIAEHKQAELEPVGVVEGSGEWGIAGVLVAGVPIGTKLYATPVRTKDLTDDELRFWIGRFPFLLNEESEKWVIGLARVIIAADREKNK